MTQHGLDKATFINKSLTFLEQAMVLSSWFRVRAFSRFLVFPIYTRRYRIRGSGYIVLDQLQAKTSAHCWNIDRWLSPLATSIATIFRHLRDCYGGWVVVDWTEMDPAQRKGILQCHWILFYETCYFCPLLCCFLLRSSTWTGSRVAARYRQSKLTHILKDRRRAWTTFTTKIMCI